MKLKDKKKKQKTEAITVRKLHSCKKKTLAIYNMINTRNLFSDYVKVSTNYRTVSDYIKVSTNNRTV